MLFRTYIPSYPLSDFVDHFFYFEGLNPQHHVERFLPDGNTEIIIDLTGIPQHIYDNVTLQEIQACRNVWVSGVRTEFITIPSGKESKLLVVTFKKGKAFPFYPMPMSELKDRVVDADLIFGSDIHDLREQLLDCRKIDKMFELVETFLYRISRSSLQSSAASGSIDYAVGEIIRNPGMVRFDKLSSEIGYSQKHFINLFRRQVGVGPKEYLKIIRFQKAIQEIENSTLINWNTISFESGFYDQAHFIHDFKLFSGFTPTDYMRRKSIDLNYIPL